MQKTRLVYATVESVVSDDLREAVSAAISASLVVGARYAPLS